jgi:N-acetylmuramoyl-L-alanine amidase
MAKICIDPGHGGTDRANRGPTGYIEADGVLDISLRLAAKLRAGHQVKLTRYKDMTLSLAERAKIANEWGADIFISEHTNAGPPAARGVEVIHSIHGDSGQKLAQLIYNELVAIGLPGRKVYSRESQNHPGQDYYGVIRMAKMPAVIVESEFHTHPETEKLLKDPTWREKIAEAQAKAILKFFGQNVANKGDDDLVKTKVLFDGEELEGVIIDNKTYVEVRKLCEKVKLKVYWNDKKKQVEVSK